MASRAFVWLATGGGAWSFASDWNDVTDGINPSLIVPGAQDSVSVTGPAGSNVETITGQGLALSAQFFGNSALAGSFSVGSAGVGQDGAGGLLQIAAGGTLSAGTLAVGSGSVIASGANADLLVAGQMTVGAANFYATNGGVARAGSLVLSAQGAAIYVDSTGSIEVGTVGAARPGALTVDAGAMLSGAGDANAYGAVVNNGTILATGGNLLVGALTGTGVLDIGANAELTLNDATGAGQAVMFTGQQGVLALATEFTAPSGTISLFAPDDAIDLRGSPISAATYRTTGSNLGVLTLWYGGSVADTLTLAGNYQGDVFLTAGDGAGGTLITVAPETGGTGNASPGTSGPDVYQWIGTGSANWGNALNWNDITSGADPATIAPGVNNLVSVAAPSAGSFTVIAGPANAASLAVTGDLALAGAFAIGTLTLGQGDAGPGATALDLLPGTVLTAANASIVDGGLSVSGSAALHVSGMLALGGGAGGVGLPVTSLSATAGGTITAAGITLGGGSGDSITTDPTGLIEIGGLGGAIAGAVTVDAGALLDGNGAVNPFGLIVDNGTIRADGGVLSLGSVSGTGALAIGAGAGLELKAGNAMAINFAGAGSVLLLGNEFVALTGVLSGFVQGDAIDLEGDLITGINQQIIGGNTVISLYYGTTVVNRLTLAGTFGNQKFALVPDGAGGTELVLTGNGGGGGGGGQGNTDMLAWAQPGSGPWSHASLWYDVTTGSRALAPPGAQNSVQIVGYSGSQIQNIGGPGVCANLAMYGNTELSGAFTTGTLSVGGTLAGVLTGGLVEVGVSSGLTITTQAVVADGTLAVDGTGAMLSIGGTLALGDGTPGDNEATSLLLVAGRGVARMAGLAIGGGAGVTLQTDSTGTIEIGTLGSAAAGAVTLDAGVAVAGSGSFNVGGLVVDNGTLTAQGGTLIVGAVSGTGMLAIAPEATLQLTAGESCAIDFTGAGATLLLQGSLETPGAPIAGFAPGDVIVTGSSQVTSLQFTPGGGGIGTLTLYNGSQVAGTLLLAGNYAGDTFTLTPDGEGTDIGVQANGGGGPSQGTPTPDAYLWLGGAGPSWNNAANWTDVTAGQNPAYIAPGSHNLVTIQGGTGGTVTTITGPADAAALTMYGTVALGGAYAVGALSIGSGTNTGLLELGEGTGVQAATAVVDGGITLQGGTISTSGTLTLAGGVLAAGPQSFVQAGALALTGTGSVITANASATIEVGHAGGAVAGALTVDAGAILAGAGTIDPHEAVIDRGTITAAGGTLTLGNVSGTGTLLVGVGATLALAGTASSGLLVDFAGPGTLDVLAVAPAAGIANFGGGDQIWLPVTGVTDAEYAQTQANAGILSLLAGSVVVATLTLIGVGQGQAFAVTAQNGGTILTTQQTQWGGGGGTVGQKQGGNGSGQFGVVQNFPWWQSLPQPAQAALATFQANYGNTAWVYTSPDGADFGNIAPGAANIAVVSNPGAGTIVGLPAGFNALLAQGNNPVWLTDGGAGHALIVGNNGRDTIGATGANDTLVGGHGSTVFFTYYGDSIVGGGNDTIITGGGNFRDDITTAAQAHSLLFLGSASNNVVSQGYDTIIGVGGPNANDTIWAEQSDLIFTPTVGQMQIIGGTGANVIIENAGTVEMRGGSGNGSVLFCGISTLTEYFGGAGSAAIIGGSGALSVQGGSGALSVFAGTGNTTITGAAGPSVYVLGAGNATVTAASGNHVWLAGGGNDSLVASGGNQVLWGANSTGNNVLQASNGPITMSGGHGNDTLIGGGGTALMYGGGGADVFSFTNGLSGGNDTIVGFDIHADRIDLHGFAGYSSALVNGSEQLTLSDGTHILLSGITSLAGVNIGGG